MSEHKYYEFWFLFNRKNFVNCCRLDVLHDTEQRQSIDGSSEYKRKISLCDDHDNDDADNSCSCSSSSNCRIIQGGHKAGEKNSLSFPGFSRAINLLFHRLSQQKVNVIMTFIKGHSASTPAI